MSKKRKAAKLLRRKPKSWLGVICLLFSLGGLAFTHYDFDIEGKVTDKGKIFEAFAALDTDVDSVMKMRNSPFPPRDKPRQTEWRTIVEVLDGDTVRLDGGDTVRLIGVDTPESRENRKLREDIYKMGIPVREKDLAALGQTAMVFTRSMCLGRQCWLEFENSRTDQYGRLLAYVHLQDGKILNEEILVRGFGKVYLGYPFKYKKRYILLQAGASMEKQGLWRTFQ